MFAIKETLYCPVCKAILGTRNKTEFVTSHCSECLATFIWKAGKKKPEALLDNHKDKMCGCGRCGR